MTDAKETGIEVMAGDGLLISGQKQKQKKTWSAEGWTNRKSYTPYNCFGADNLTPAKCTVHAGFKKRLKRRLSVVRGSDTCLVNKKGEDQSCIADFEAQLTLFVEGILMTSSSTLNPHCSPMCLI